MNTAKQTITAVLVGLVATLMFSATAGAFTADDSWDHGSISGPRTYGSVDYIGTRSVQVVAGARDKAGDAICTSVMAQLWTTVGGYRQMGNTIPLGSVCNGGIATFPVKTISTTVADIYEVRILTTGMDLTLCRRATDGAENCR